MENLIPLKWTTVQRKVSELLPCDFNPRTVTQEEQDKLIASLEKFGLVDIPVIDFDEVIISGHRRAEGLYFLGKADELIDCRFPNRKLTEEEFKEYMLIANSHAGEYDSAKIKMFFSEIDMSNIPGFEPVDFEEEIEKLKEPKEPKDLSDEIEQKYLIEITCVNEEEQENLYNDFINQGLLCRVLTL